MVWLWTCLAGFILGLLGLSVYALQRRAAASAADTRQPDGPGRVDLNGRSRSAGPRATDAHPTEILGRRLSSRCRPRPSARCRSDHEPVAQATAPPDACRRAVHPVTPSGAHHCTGHRVAPSTTTAARATTAPSSGRPRTDRAAAEPSQRLAPSRRSRASAPGPGLPTTGPPEHLDASGRSNTRADQRGVARAGDQPRRRHKPAPARAGRARRRLSASITVAGHRPHAGRQVDVAVRAKRSGPPRPRRSTRRPGRETPAASGRRAGRAVLRVVGRGRPPV